MIWSGGLYSQQPIVAFKRIPRFLLFLCLYFQIICFISLTIPSRSFHLNKVRGSVGLFQNFRLEGFRATPTSDTSGSHSKKIDLLECLTSSKQYVLYLSQLLFYPSHLIRRWGHIDYIQLTLADKTKIRDRNSSRTTTWRGAIELNSEGVSERSCFFLPAIQLCLQDWLNNKIATLA